MQLNMIVGIVEVLAQEEKSSLAVDRGFRDVDARQSCPYILSLSIP